MVNIYEIKNRHKWNTTIIEKIENEETSEVGRQNTHLILVNSSTSSLLQPCVQPENASMSISYLRWSTKNGPFCLRSLITLFPYLPSSFFLICSLFHFIFFSFVLFSISFSFLFYFYFYDDFFVYFTYMLSNDVPKRRTLHSSRISNIIDSNDI